jgi:2'-5' RNA ligase
MHLTLHFIGPVARDRGDPAARLALPAPRFTLALSRTDGGCAACGCVVQRCRRRWPSSRRLAGVLRAAGLPVEARAFQAHLTLARKAATARAPAEPLAVRWSVQGYALMESRNGYHPLARYGPHGFVAKAGPGHAA